MNKDQIINYIQQKGNFRKGEMFESMKFQTQDYVRSKAANESVGSMGDAIIQQRADWQQEQQRIADEQMQNQAEIVTLNQTLVQKKEQLQREQQDDSSKFTNIMKSACDFDSKIVADINKIFEANSPPSLVQGLEHFVALLRNNSFTQAVDVELFFMDADKLRRKMKRVKTIDVSLALATDKLEKLEALKNKFTMEGPDDAESGFDLSPFYTFIKWAINYCQAAKIDLRVQATRDEVAEIENRIESLQVLAGRFGRMHQDTQELNFSEFFEKASQNVATRKEFLNNVTETDRSQAEEYQKKFRTFERKYFESLMEQVQQASNQ